MVYIMEVYTSPLLGAGMVQVVQHLDLSGPQSGPQQSCHQQSIPISIAELFDT